MAASDHAHTHTIWALALISQYSYRVVRYDKSDQGKDERKRAIMCRSIIMIISYCERLTVVWSPPLSLSLCLSSSPYYN